MPWLRLKLEADKHRVEQIIQVLDECGALSVTVKNRGEQPQCQEQTDTAVFWAHNRITGSFSANADVRRHHATNRTTYRHRSRLQRRYVARPRLGTGLAGRISAAIDKYETLDMSGLLDTTATSN